MGEVLAVILGILIIILCVVAYLFVLWASLWIGGIGGFFIGVFKAIKNYFTSLKDNLGTEE